MLIRTVIAIASFIPALMAVTPSRAAAVFTTVYTFPDKAHAPSGPVAALLPYDGALYGTTQYGGYNDHGTLFKLIPAHSKAVTIHEFGDGGTVDGINPVAELIELNGKLVGTTPFGGLHGVGMAFSIDPVTSTESVLYNFVNGNHGGTNPETALLAQSGLLYGTTSSGGKERSGTLFQLDPETRAEKTLFFFPGSFKKPLGYQPASGVARIGQSLYGVLPLGGVNSTGTIYRFTIPSQKLTTVYQFGPVGEGDSQPSTPLLAFNDILYGTAQGAGSMLGAVYSFDPATRTETVLHRFTGQGHGDGAYPNGPLVALGGLLYGTTRAGGAHGLGTIYSVDPTTGAEAVLYSFTGAEDGKAPSGALVEFKGALYGCANAGGNANHGALFRLQP